MDNLWSVLWLGLMVGFLILEASTVKLMSIWFAAGALAALILNLLGAALWVQVTAFFLLSIGLLCLLWPVTKKVLKPRLTATNTDALTGRICTVTEAIDPVEGGRVKVGDVTWSARSEEAIPAGKLVRILSIQGAKVLVEEAKKELEV